jgi:hypothetical protein
MVRSAQGGSHTGRENREHNDCVVFAAMRLLLLAACCLGVCTALGPYLYGEDVLQVRKTARS